MPATQHTTETHKGKLKGDGKAEEVGKRKKTSGGKTSSNLKKALRSSELEAKWKRTGKQTVAKQNENKSEPRSKGERCN